MSFYSDCETPHLDALTESAGVTGATHFCTHARTHRQILWFASAPEPRSGSFRLPLLMPDWKIMCHLFSLPMYTCLLPGSQELGTWKKQEDQPFGFEPFRRIYTNPSVSGDYQHTCGELQLNLWKTRESFTSKAEHIF